MDRLSTEPAQDAPAEANDDAISALVKLGVAARSAADYVRRGDLEGAAFDAVLLPGRLKRTVTPAAIEAQGGLPVAAIAELMQGFGLPRPSADEPVFTPEEAQVFIALKELEDLWPPEVRLQVARVYGARLGGIARAELQAFLLDTEPRVRHHGGDAFAQLRSVQSAFAQLLPLTDPLLLGVHRRWIEHELAQRSVSAAELHTSADALPGAVDVSILFCDLKDFTAYAEAHGDGAALGAVDRFFDVVARERGESGQFVKSLGDGAMLVYDDPSDAVAAGARVIAAMRLPDLPGVHASVHSGTVIARSGDYFGGAVNLAARLLALAERDELLVSAAVAAACRDGFDWTPAGERKLRGVATPVEVYRLTSTA